MYKIYTHISTHIYNVRYKYIYIYIFVIRNYLVFMAFLSLSSCLAHNMISGNVFLRFVVVVLGVSGVF